MPRFAMANTIDGYEVIDADGRSVTDSYTFANRPLKIAAMLNEAADSEDTTELRRALGCIGDDEEDFGLETLANEAV